jgi:hypothetical protein
MSEPASNSIINPWWRIWMQPRQTIRYLIETDPKMHFWILAVFYGVIRAFSWALQITMGDYFSPSGVAAFILIGGPIAGIIGIYLTAWLLELIGNLFGGLASGEQIRTVLAWSAIPMNVLVIIGFLPMLVLFGSRIFTTTDPQVQYFLNSQSGTAGFLGSGLVTWQTSLDLIGSLYYLVIAVVCFAEVQKFGLWKSAGTFIIVLGGLLLGVLALGMLS